MYNNYDEHWMTINAYNYSQPNFCAQHFRFKSISGNILFISTTIYTSLSNDYETIID